jgi:hypothetical protein
VASDNFTRANANPLDGNWATSSAWGNLQLVSNAVVIVTASTDSVAVSTASIVTDSQVTLTTTAAGTIAGPALHLSTTAGDGYAFLHNTGFWHVYELPAFTDLGSWGTVPVIANGDIVRLRRGPGNTLIGSVNGVDRVTTAATTTYLGGAPGMFIFDGTTVLDDWTDNTVGGGGTPLLGQASL